MNIVITVMALIMVLDSGFTLLNLSKVESVLHAFFPKMNVKKLAFVEGLAGLFIIILKISTKSLI